uniref:Protein kinase domain-containing protein n=1 Tax=Rhabditophanes sp. KR3021 TaxID=114890 RepID=A0AC35U0G7_9BILA
MEDPISPYSTIVGNKPEIKDITNDVCQKLQLLQHILATEPNLSETHKRLISLDSMSEDTSSVTSKCSVNSFSDDTCHSPFTTPPSSTDCELKIRPYYGKRNGYSLSSGSSGYSDTEIDDHEMSAEQLKTIQFEANEAFQQECYAKCVRLIEGMKMKKLNLDLFLLCSKSYKKMLLDSLDGEEHEKLVLWWLEFIEKVETANTSFTYQLHLLHTKNDCLWKCITQADITITRFITITKKLFQINWKMFESVSHNEDCNSYDYLTSISNIINILRFCVDEGMNKEEKEHCKSASHNSLDSLSNGFPKKPINYLQDNKSNSAHLSPILRIEIINVKNCLKSFGGKVTSTDDSVKAVLDDEEKGLYSQVTLKLREIEEDFVRKSMTRSAHTPVSQTSSNKSSSSTASNVILRKNNSSNHQTARNTKSTPITGISNLPPSPDRRISSSANERGSHFLKLMIEPKTGIKKIEEENNFNPIIVRF